MRLGAKYRVAKNPTVIYECVYVGKLAVLKTPENGEFAVFNTNWFAYEEVIEPRREFFNAYHKTSDDTFYGGPYRSRSDADLGSEVNRFGRYGVLELIHHSDTRVESVFHMVARK